MDNNTTSAPLSVDLKLTYKAIQRRFSCSSKRPSWKALSNQIKDRFDLDEAFHLGLSYVDDDGEAVVLSSDKELEHVWPIITEDDERDLDSLPPLRFNIVQLPSSRSTTGNTAIATTPSSRGESVNTIVEDDIEEDIVDEVASGISDIDIVDAEDGDNDDKDGDDDKKKKKKPTKKTTLQEDIRSFIDTVKGTVQDNEDIHKAFHKIIAHIHKPPHKKPEEGDGNEEKEGSAIALAILAEETGKMDAMTAGIVSALLAPAFMGPFGRHHHSPHGHHGHFGPPPPPPPHFGNGRHGPGRGGRHGMPPPPPPGCPPHRGFEHGPGGRPPFPPPPPHHARPHFPHGPADDFEGPHHAPFPGMFKHGLHAKGRGCPYGMHPPFPHMMHEPGFFRGRRGGLGPHHHHTAPGHMFGRDAFGRHAACEAGPPFGGPDRRHQFGRHGPRARFFEDELFVGHLRESPKHHSREQWKGHDGDLPFKQFEGMRMEEVDSDSEDSSASSSEEEFVDLLKLGRGRQAEHRGHGRRNSQGPPPHHGPHGRRHYSDPHGPQPHAKRGSPRDGDMPPPPPHRAGRGDDMPGRHHHDERRRHGRWP